MRFVRVTASVCGHGATLLSSEARSKPEAHGTDYLVESGLPVDAR